MTFHHLPFNTDERLQFHLTSDSFQVLDYALLEGSSPNRLRIKSFFNFGRYKVTNQRLVTIMLDTISCFVGYGCSKPLHQHPKIQGMPHVHCHRSS